ncbi:hypothetical protein E4U55_001575, partial [Claviceps digitariae]
FQLRFSPALANKPKSTPVSQPHNPDAHAHAHAHAANPFAHPHPSLFIADVGPSHYLVLNKFAVVPEHFILATRTFKPQSHVLEQADLEATMSCLEGYAAEHRADGAEDEAEDEAEDREKEEWEEDEEEELFAFFNSGEHSGASQAHRHVQFLPVQQMRRGLREGEGQGVPRWELLAGKVGGRGGGMEEEMPFVVFSEELRPGMRADEVYGVYGRLYREGCRAVMRMGGGDGGDGDGGEAPGEGPARISYNLGLTRRKMLLCPRLAEGGPVLGEESGQEVGRLALNGTVLAGTALVKSEGEWEALRRRPRGLVDVLRGIGIPREALCRDVCRDA